jgi:hypothetical protein
MKNENPAARANRANRVPDVIFAGDIWNPKAFTPNIQSETLAARTLAKRFGLTIQHARVVCELAGIGGKAA